MKFQDQTSKIENKKKIKKSIQLNKFIKVIANT